MTKLFKTIGKFIVKAVAAVFTILALIACVAILVLVVPFISLLIGLWIGFATEWAFGDFVFIGDLPSFMATIFFVIASVIMLIKVNTKKAE